MTRKMSEQKISTYESSSNSYCNYRCTNCGYESKIENSLIDCAGSPFGSVNSRPEFQCICGGKLRPLPYR